MQSVIVKVPRPSIDHIMLPSRMGRLYRPCRANVGVRYLLRKIKHENGLADFLRSGW